MHKRTLIIHGIPPFVNKKAIDHNMRFLFGHAYLDWDCVQSITNHLHTTTSDFLKIVMLREFDAKTFFQSFRSGKRYFRMEEDTYGNDLIDHVIHNVFQIHSTSVNIKEQNIHIIIQDSRSLLFCCTAQPSQGKVQKLTDTWSATLQH